MGGLSPTLPGRARTVPWPEPVFVRSPGATRVAHAGRTGTDRRALPARRWHGAAHPGTGNEGCAGWGCAPDRGRTRRHREQGPPPGCATAGGNMTQVPRQAGAPLHCAGAGRGAAAARAATFAACVVLVLAGCGSRLVLRWPGRWGWPRRDTRSRKHDARGRQSARAAASSRRRQQHWHNCNFRQ